VVAGNVTNATILGLAIGTTYYFAATSYDAAGDESTFSNEASYDVTNTPAKPAAIVNNNGGTGSNVATRILIATAQSSLKSALAKSPTAAGQAATLAPSVQAGGSFSFTVSGSPGRAYVVQASSNLQDWISLATNTAPFVFVDPAAAQFSQRFYRTASPAQ